MNNIWPLAYDLELRQPMNRLRATFGFIFSGGLLTFLSPYLIHEAAIKKLPWSVPMRSTQGYHTEPSNCSGLIIGKAGTTTQEKDEPNRRN
jgi:hypothetical protein